MRVLMVGPFAKRRGENDGGVSAVMSYLAEALLRSKDIELHGARVSGSVRNDSSDDSLGFPVHNVGVRRFGFATAFVHQRTRFAEIVKQVNPDIVHGQGADLCGLLALRSGQRSIVTVHGILGEDARFQTRFTARVREHMSSVFIERPVIRESPALILISPYVADYYGSAIRGSIFQIPNPVDQSYFDIDPQPISGRILFAGRVIPRKGVIELVQAFAALSHPGRRLVIAGSLADQAYVAEVRRVANELGVADQLDFVGLLRDEAMLAEMGRSQVLALPSFQETAPMVILEAMAAGIPVVASRICGIPYQIDEGVTGCMFNPGDIRDLSSQLEFVLADSTRAKAMGSAARDTAFKRFHARSVGSATIEAYRATLALNG